MTLFTISVNIKHISMCLNSAVFKLLSVKTENCTSRVWSTLCFNDCTRTQNRLPCDIAKWSTLLNMHWEARHFHPCSLKHENYCLDTFYFCWVYNVKPHCSNLRTITANFECPKVSIWAATWQNQQNECTPSEDSDQPGHPPSQSLIRVFAVRMKKAWVLSYPLSAQWRLWSDWADAKADVSLRWAHSHFVGFVISWLICYGNAR